MKRKLLTFIIFLCTFFVQQNLKAQTTLAPGDIAFIGYQTGTTTDGFSFITLKDMSMGTMVYFTENGWGDGTWVPLTPETHLLWTVPAFTPAGTIISIVEAATADTFTVTGTTTASITIATGSGFNLLGGDQILAYQSLTGPEPATTPTFIAGIHGDYNSSKYDPITTWNTVDSAASGGGSESSLPPGLTNGVNCISLFPGVMEQANSKYIGTLTGSVAELLAKINNPSASYWSHSTGAADLGITPVGYPAPAVSTVVVATVTTATATSVKAVSAVMGGNLSATGGDATVQRGIVWATTAAPTISNNKVQNGTGIGTFSATITGLPSATLIHYRAYSTNSAGTSYGTELTLTTGAGLSTSSTPQVDILCNGGNTGSATVNVTGGTPTYTYSWFPSGGTGSSASSLTAGTYTVTITDTEASQITRNFTISEPAVIVGTPSTTAETCFGLNNGTATITPSGGVGSYTYLWSNGATTATASGLAPGTYSVTVTDGNACSKTIPGISVGGPTAALTATTSTTPVSCFLGGNGTASVSAFGGTGVRTYLWSNGATTATTTGLAAGTYSVTVKDANLCSVTIPGIVVGGPTAAVSGTYVTTPVTCFGANNGSATVTASGGVPGYTYSWSPSGGTGATASNLGSGTYSVTITDNNGCPTTVTGIVVGGPTGTLNGSITTTSVTCFGGANGTATVAAFGGTPNYTYLWSNGATTATASGLVTGTYSVTVTDANACSRTISNIFVGTRTAINPTPTQVNVSCNGGNNGSATVTPTGGGGSGTYTYLWSNGATSATASNLLAGNYSVTITNSLSCSVTQAFTITEPPLLVASQDTFTNPSCNTGTNGSATVAVSGGTLPYTYSWSPSGGTAATASGLEDGTYIVTVTDAKGCTATQSFTLVEPAAIVVTSTQNNILCHGDAVGSASVTATGGTGAYNYSWSPTGGTAATASGLTAGTYTVTVTDANSCQGTETITITEPFNALSTAQGTVTNVNCFGEATGSATVIAAGGTGSYSYSWSPSGGTGATASALTAGSYIVTVTDDNGCTATENFNISGPGAALSASTASTAVSCFNGTNGTAGVTVFGGTPSYTYSWSPSGGTGASASGLSAGDYTVTITDSKGCTLAKTINVGTPTEISGTISKVDVSCNGGSNGSATVTASGGTAGYSYLWAPTGGNASTASGLTAGNYTVTIQDANTCTLVVPVTIDEPTVLTTTISHTDVLCNGGSTGTATVIATGGTGTYSYVWSPTGGTAATATGLATGNYSCTITDGNGCFKTESVTIGAPTILTATTSQINSTCIVGGQATVTPSGGAGSYTYLWSPSGQTTATATGLSAGSHFCLITDANGCTLTKNFVITTTNTLVAATSQTDVLCNGANTGMASVVPSGAPGPFSYVWAPSGGTADTASNLTAGNYSVTITSANGCSIVKNFTITEPVALVVTPSQIDLLCNGATTGQASVSVTGGTGAYTYAWSPSGGTAATATGLTAGTYTVTITDANLCQATQSFTIIEPNAITATIAPTNVSCNAGTTGAATVTATGGTGTYTYSWAPSGGTAATATGLTAGTYTVTVTDANSCTTTQSVTLTEPAQLVASVGSQTDVTCNGLNNGSATVNVTGGTGTYTYAWAPSGGTAPTATGLSPGTYTVTVTDANSCTATQSFTITEPTLLSASITGQTDITCNGGTTGATTVTATGGTGTYTYAWAPSGGTAATATGLSAGTYTVTVTDANSCTTTQSVTITEPDALTATIAPINVSCNGGTTGAATVTATGGTGTYTYLWAPSGGTAATATGLTAGTYTVNVTDANSCTTTQTVTLTEPSQLVASVGGQTDVTCNGLNNGSATVNVTGGTGTYTYAWTPSGGITDTATGLSPGTYTVTVTDANSCTATQSFTITEPTLLTASITAQTNVTCNGQANGAATVTATGGTGTFTYSWAPSGGNAATATALSGGTYTVTITDTNNCTTTQSVTITEPNVLTATIMPTNVSCHGGTTGAATVNATGGSGTYTYLWAPSGGTAATATGLTAGTYTVTVTDANSCTTTQTVTITEPSQLVASVGGQTDVTCNGLNNGSATVNVTGGTGTYTYAWTPSGGTAPTATGLSPGTYTVTVTDTNSCTATQSFTITEPALLTASITAQTNVTCNGQADGSATVTPTGGTGTYTYLWAPSGGNAATATALSGGTYTVTITDTNNCTATQSVTITEPNVLTATIMPTNVSCHGGTTGAATVNATGGSGTYTYLWAPSGGTAATATGLTAGTYTVTVTDANSCTTTQTVTITEPSQLVASVGGQTDVTCNGLNNGSATVNVTGGTGTYTYAWTPSGGTAPTATGLSPGTYTVTVTDTNSCTATQSFTITEPALLTASITAQTNVTCNGQADGSATVTPTGGTGTYTYLWAPSGGNAATATALSGGTYTVTITDTNNCTATQSVTITEPNVLTATIMPTNVSCHGGTTGAATVNATGGSGTYTYLWAPSGGTAATATGLTAGTYTVNVTDANSCTTTQTVTLTEPSQLVASVGGQTDVTCNGLNNGSAAVNVTGGTGTYTYAWAPSGGTAPTATGLSPGTYTVTVTDANSCTATQSFTITEPSVLASNIASQTNVSCSGLSNGAAIINITGGVTPYTYLWSNSSTTKDISGVAAGTYTLTITDANNCSATQSVTILTVPDVTSPVPTVANLPEITGYCSVLSSQIPIPTATDNCAGTINGTTSSPLNYTTDGSYVITWRFDDGSGNISTQNQTVKVISSPINLVTFSNAEYTFDANTHTIQVANLPAGASVVYSTFPTTGTNNGATNAGVYAVTATISPSAAAPNCSPVILTANLTIKKAAQQITFGALLPRILGANNDFNLQALSNSGLPIRFSFTYTSTLPPANVSASGVVNMLRSGELLITAHQDGNENYLPAADVSQLLVIKNNDITVQSITIGSKVYNNPSKDITYLMSCGENNPNIAIVNQTNATITPGANFSIATPKPGIYTKNVTITSQDGTATATYNIKVEKPFAFYDIVKQKFNNILLVNNNPLTNGGYVFVSFQWFKNGQLVGTGPYYSAGNDPNSTLDPLAIYSVKMATLDGKVLQTCDANIVLQNSLQAKLYPNPIEVGKVITVEADFPQEELQNMQITFYSVSGKLVKTVKSSSVITEIQLPETAGSNMYLVVLETGNITKSFKVIVK
ncbi:T9SS type A sorting domain-containing protein [Flavobacterium sp. LC2016-12]|uniref:T9SS type A sorting domain-containing protein n=1 Tax=Flavobacterium sp. LC2016-12 TaxID=2783794 RepID=UPI00188A82C9|nr:T9SS type A sorting domain-containing protein [Flavobacterium sp. LC2016-12]MBF4465046.1 T9SS type A sorting domain-containing protein [Flavobacterium sp. LC2016-12]